MRLIDADKLLLSFKDYFDGKKTIGQIIDEQPTADFSCNGCEHITKDADKIPCCDCKRSHRDYYEKSEVEDGNDD